VARVDKNTDDEETSQPDGAAAFAAASCKHAMKHPIARDRLWRASV
jgi:hypothetical protein